jgi:hypothetical protein
MLTIENFNKIKNQWFGDWQIGKVSSDTSYYALQAFHKDGKRSITVAIFREGKLSNVSFEPIYPISLIDDAKGSSSIIDDVIYKSVLDDMEIFGESLVHYLNTI